jgi:hypothetical protein
MVEPFARVEDDGLTFGPEATLRDVDPATEIHFVAKGASAR